MPRLTIDEKLIAKIIRPDGIELPKYKLKELTSYVIDDIRQHIKEIVLAQVGEVVEEYEGGNY